MNAIAVDIRKVSKTYGNVVAVEALDLLVPEGAFVALLGSSGCGKTTTLRMIAGLEQPSTGDIYVKGLRVNDVPVHRRNVGMVFQNHALFPHRTAYDNIAFGLKYRKVPKAEIARRVRRALEVVRLQHCEDRFPAQLSGGQQQRIAVARAIVIEPDLLLFDEPLSALDAGLREEMRGELKRIQRSLGITTVFVTHDQAEALSMADKVVVMHAGRKQQEGSPEEVYRRPESEFVMRFFGQVNEAMGQVRGQENGLLQVEIGEGVVVGVAGAMPESSSVRLLVRAERLRVATRFNAAEGCTILQGRITAIEYLGLMARYDVQVGAITFQAMQPTEGEALAAGMPVELCVRSDDWTLNGRP